jgi:deoxyadenosine/deoxycytidine kinase
MCHRIIFDIACSQYITIDMPKVLVIQGEIGAGKSTLLQLLSASLPTDRFPRVVVIREPSELWTSTGALEDFYRDPKRNALSFQMFAFITRINLVYDTYKADPHADLYIVERSPDSDLIFAELQLATGSMTQMEYDRYLITWKGWQRMWPFAPTHTLYLCPSINACMTRVHNRARVGESTVSSDYQTQLREAHEQYMSTCTTPVLRVHHDTDWRKGTERDQLLDSIVKFLNTV